MKNRGLLHFRVPVRFLWGILGILSVLMILYYGYQKGTEPSYTLRLCVLSLILISIVVFYIMTQQKVLKEFPFFNSVFIITFITSLLLIILTDGKAELHLWLVGGLLVAMLFDVSLGYIVTYNLIFFASFVGGLGIEAIVYLLVAGTLFCLLSGYLKNPETIFYALIIILSLQIVMLFIINSFILKDTITVDAVYSVVSSLMAIIGSLGACHIYKSITGRHGNQPIQQEDGVSDTPAEEDRDGTHTLEEITNVNFPLMERLKQHSENLYRHSLLIGEISGNAAQTIGADERKARAGGMYHEIGRLIGRQYIEEGIKLAEEYHLPGSIKDIIRQHNLKYEKPKSPEAAIVMMTVSFIATREYLEKTMKDGNGNPGDKTVPSDKIVDNLFQLRLTKGSLDESGLTVQEFNQLKEFYLHM